MIIVRATMWPLGDSGRSYELLHASIRNIATLAEPDHYMAHVLARPNRFLRVPGYETDVEVLGHRRSDGCAGLIAAVLKSGLNRLPEERMMARVMLTDAAEFEEALKRRPT